MDNIEYFEYSKNNKDEVKDFVQSKGIKVINESPDEEPTELMITVNNLNELITTYSTLKSMNKKDTDPVVIEIVDKISKILGETKVKINYSPFCAYFLVLRTSYSTYKSNYKNMSVQEKRDLLIDLLNQYLENRYKMYKYHGYTHAVLQVMSDVASSRRNSTIGIEMLKSILLPLGLVTVNNYDEFKNKNFCFIDSDKKGKKIFTEFLKDQSVAFEFQKSRENKYPDMLIKIKKDYFILEHKLTNGGGGSQNAEINEIIDFIRYDEKNKNIHFISCLQGDFIKNLEEYSTQPKNVAQRENIIKALKEHPNNYFLNGKALEKLIKDYKK